jgi:hypothetical protein
VYSISNKKINNQKISVSFTWDDNSVNHFEKIGPLFEKFGLRCTFFVVPGDSNFQNVFLDKYTKLSLSGFEIGSHSYSHKQMTKLVENEWEFEFSEAINCILKFTGKYPVSFAFPYHDFNDNLLKVSRKFHLETRNTLNNSIRFSLKTTTTLKDLIASLGKAIFLKQDLVFSGHSVITTEELKANKAGEGYEPMNLKILEDFLGKLISLESSIKVVPFSHAVILEFIRNNSTANDDFLFLNQASLNELSKFGINKISLDSII